MPRKSKQTKKAKKASRPSRPTKSKKSSPKMPIRPTKGLSSRMLFSKYTPEEKQKIKDVLVYGLRKEIVEHSLLGFNCVPFIGEIEEKQICKEVDRVLQKLLTVNDLTSEDFENLLLSWNTPNDMMIPSDWFRFWLQDYGTFWKNLDFDACEEGRYVRRKK